MACTGHNGTYPVGVPCTGYIGPGTAYSFTTPDLIGGVHNVQEYHYNQIRQALEQELVRRGWSWATVGGDPGVVYQGSTAVGYYHWRALRDRIYNVKAWSYAWTANAYLYPGVPIHEESVEELRAHINDARDDCACVCNYGCTCNCAYCTCNCAYCTCDCNYYCTCNCYYSDLRLKKDVKYL